MRDECLAGFFHAYERRKLLLGTLEKCTAFTGLDTFVLTTNIMEDGQTQLTVSCYNGTCGTLMSSNNYVRDVLRCLNSLFRTHSTTHVIHDRKAAYHATTIACY